MIILFNSDYERLIGFLDQYYDIDKNYIIITTSDIIVLYLKKFRKLKIHNIKCVSVYSIYMVRDKFNKDKDYLFILDLDIINSIVHIRSLSNHIHTIGIYRYFCITEKREYKPDHVCDIETRLIEGFCDRIMRRLGYTYKKYTNQIHYYIK